MPPWDEVARANSERLKDPTLTQSPRREGGEWCRQTNPIEFEARGTALSAILLSSNLFRKDFLCSAATGGAGSALSQTTGFSPNTGSCWFELFKNRGYPFRKGV